MDDLDNVTPPKANSLGCDDCPFEYLCEGMCILGYEDLDEVGGVLPYDPKSVAS